LQTCIFQGAHKGNEDERWFVREMFVFPSLWFLPWVLVSLDSMTKKKKKSTRVHLLCRHEQRFPRFTRAQSIGGHRESSSTGRTITTRNRVCPFVSSFSVLLYIKLLLFDFFACVVIKFISSFSFFFFFLASQKYLDVAL
jgi:hypothetical protein